jgi:hypothetical protein
VNTREHQRASMKNLRKTKNSYGKPKDLNISLKTKGQRRAHMESLRIEQIREDLMKTTSTYGKPKGN